MNRSHAISAIAAIAVMLVCAVAPVVSGAGVAEYTIDMRAGDSFSYSPTTNLPASFDSAPDIEGVSWDVSKRTMTASFDSPKPSGVQVLVLAHWTSSDGSISQDAKQAINFRVFSHVSIDCDSAVAVPAGVLAGSVILKPEISAAEEGTETVVTCELAENPYIEWDSSKNAVVAKSDITSADSARYAIKITATNSSTDAGSTLRPETVTAGTTISIGSPLAIQSYDLETYVGCGDYRNTWTVKTNMDRSGIEIVKTIVAPSDVPEGLIVSNENGTITIDPSKADIGDADSKAYAFSARAVAVIDGETVEATGEFSVIVWKSLEYLTTPSIENVQLMPGADAREVTLSASVSKAAVVTVDWGNGEVPVRAAVQDGKITASAFYEDSGRHVIAVTAVNGSGTGVVHYVLYDASTGYFEDYKPAEKKESASAVWLLFLLLAGVFAALYFVFGYRHPAVLLCMIASAVLAAMFCAGWL